jgi:hypothetical protein
VRHEHLALRSALGLTTLVTDLKAVWHAPTTDARLKKRIVRTVIQEVVADIDQNPAEIVLIVHWIGGVHSELRLPKRRRGQRNSTSGDIIAATRQLVLIANGDLIAGTLNRNGLVTGHGNHWTRERVTSLRSHHRIPVYKPAEDGIEPWLNLSRAARLLHVTPKTLMLAAEAGEIEAVYPLPNGPWIFSRVSLTGIAAQNIAGRARQNPNTPRDRIPISKASSLQSHRQMGVVMQGCTTLMDLTNVDTALAKLPCKPSFTAPRWHVKNRSEAPCRSNPPLDCLQTGTSLHCPSDQIDTSIF